MHSPARHLCSSPARSKAQMHKFSPSTGLHTFYIFLCVASLRVFEGCAEMIQSTLVAVVTRRKESDIRSDDLKQPRAKEGRMRISHSFCFAYCRTRVLRLPYRAVFWVPVCLISVSLAAHSSDSRLSSGCQSIGCSSTLIFWRRLACILSSDSLGSSTTRFLLQTGLASFGRCSLRPEPRACLPC